MKQRTLTFKTRFERKRLMNSAGWQPDSWLEQAELKSSLLKRGYIVKELRSYPVIVTECMAAKANIPRVEREKIQKEVDGLPTPKIIQIKK